MTTHLIGYDDVTYLGYNISYLEKLPQHIEAFKIKLGLVPENEYGKYREPAMDQAVATALQGSPLWRTSAKQPVKNGDLWRALIDAAAPHRIDWVWIKGHAGHPDNERADKLASDAAFAQMRKKVG